MSELAEFMVHQVSVDVLTGSGGMGEVYAAPVTAMVFCDEARSLVISRDGRQLISDCTLYDADMSRQSTWVEGSLVTLPSGRKAKVITTNARTAGDLDLPDHLEVKLT